MIVRIPIRIGPRFLLRAVRWRGARVMIRLTHFIHLCVHSLIKFALIIHATIVFRQFDAKYYRWDEEEQTKSNGEPEAIKRKEKLLADESYDCIVNPSDGFALSQVIVQQILDVISELKTPAEHTVNEPCDNVIYVFR